MTPLKALISCFFALSLLATACGSSTTQVETSEGNSLAEGDGDDSYVPGDPTDPADDELPEGPIPVEPDGGIGDGAEPLPGAEEPADEGTWHGAEVAETNCPGMEWKRVQASAFSFSVPVDFFDNEPQGIDSEVGSWTGGNKMEVSYDYGWYSGSISSQPGAENEPVDYSGIIGERTIIRDQPGKRVGVYFGEVTMDNDTANALSMLVSFTDANDEIIGRCIVGSIDWG